MKRLLLIWVAMLLWVGSSGTGCEGVAPEQKTQPLTFRDDPAGQMASWPVGVEVMDLLTGRPLPGVRVTITGLGVIGFTNQAGQVIFHVPATLRLVAVRAEVVGYMTTTRTRITLPTNSPIRLGLPFLTRLEEADRLIRDPAIFSAHRQQAMRPDPPALAVPFDNTGGRGAITYPVPKTIQVKKSDGSIITLDLEEYVKGVVPKEIGTSAGMEALKAQAVAARTYSVHYTSGGTKPICDTASCQVWGPTHYNSTDQAVDATRGVVAVHQGTLIGAYFSASCGGSTINSEDRWSYRAYLRAKPCI